FSQARVLGSTFPQPRPMFIDSTNQFLDAFAGVRTRANNGLVPSSRFCASHNANAVDTAPISHEFRRFRAVALGHYQYVANFHRSGLYRLTAVARTWHLHQ